MESFFSEKQQRLLVEPLYTSWGEPGRRRTFIAMSKVGVYYGVHSPAFVPDVSLGLNVTVPADLRPRAHRAYFAWDHGKAPEVVIEVVSSRDAGEDSGLMAAYARIAVRYYAIFDPECLLSAEVLRAYCLRGGTFEKLDEPVWFAGIGLGLRLWQGQYEDHEDTWLRWVDEEGRPIPTGNERAALEHQQAEAERQRADRLAEQLRRLGVEPQEP